MAFKKGQSGNPKGRPKGILDRRHFFKLFDEKEREAVIAKMKEMVEEGNEAMIKFIIMNLYCVGAQTRVHLDLSQSSTFNEKCYLMDQALYKGEIGLETYKYLNEVLTKRYNVALLEERVEKLWGAYEEQSDKET